MNTMTDVAMLGQYEYIRAALDFYQTPRECVDVLPFMDGSKIWEPACGDGAISSVLEEKGVEAACAQEAATVAVKACLRRAELEQDNEALVTDMIDIKLCVVFDVCDFDDCMLYCDE